MIKINVIQKAGLVPAFFLLLTSTACVQDRAESLVQEKLNELKKESALLEDRFVKWKATQCPDMQPSTCQLVDSLLIELKDFNQAMANFSVNGQNQDVLDIGLADLEYRIGLISREAVLLKP